MKNRGITQHCAIMLDTKGPEIRTGKLKDKTLQLVAGREIIVTTDLSVVGDDKRIVIDYQDLAKSAKVGNKILIADGTIALTIKEILDEKSVKCVVNHTCILGENKNVHLPGISKIMMIYIFQELLCCFLQSRRKIEQTCCLE